MIGLSSADASHRSHGCLYDIERYGDNPVAYVPAAVSRIAAIQKTLSAVFIFLFGLALRNMLKLKWRVQDASLRSSAHGCPVELCAW